MVSDYLMNYLTTGMNHHLSVIDELDRIGIIHRDISLNNIILVDNHPSPYRKGYLIDYDYATRKDGTGEAAKGKRTVSTFDILTSWPFSLILSLREP